MIKFQRNYHITVDTEADENLHWNGTSWQNVETDKPCKEPAKAEITMPFTMTFDINRNVMSGANTSRITLYNLNADTRKKIYKDQFRTAIYKGITVRAGYGMENNPKLLPIIFKGNLKCAYSKREGTEYLTEIEAYDGGFAFVNGYQSTNFVGGSQRNDVIDTLINGLPHINKGAVGDFNDIMPRGNALTGSAIENLQQITNGNVCIDCEKAYCLLPNEYLEGDLQVVRADTGLLSCPVREETYLKIRTLFEPRVRVGQGISLESTTNSEFNGLYKVMGFRHHGTISAAQGGSCETEMTLYYGVNKLVGTN